MRNLVICCFCVVSFSGMAQIPTIAFERTFGGPSSDAGLSVIQTSDSDYVFVGSFFPNPVDNDKSCIGKVDNDGNLLWFYHDSTNISSASSAGYSVLQANDGNYVTCGFRTLSESLPVPGVRRKSWLHKTTPAGVTIFQKHYSALSNIANEESHQLVQTYDNGYAMVGGAYYASEDSTYWNAWNDSTFIDGALMNIKRVDPAGNLLWSKLYGTPGSDAWSLIQLPDSGFMAIGYEQVPNQWSDAVVFRTDKNGNQLWKQHYGGSNYDYGYSIAGITGTEFILLSTTMSSGNGGLDLLLTKIDDTGAVIWEKTFGGIDDDYGNSVSRTSDGGFIIGGSTQNFNSDYFDVYLIKTDSLGNEEWHYTLGSSTYDGASDVKETMDGGYILTGIRNAQIHVVKLTADGNLAVSDLEENSALSLSPNPANELIAVHFPDHKDETGILTLVDAMGKEVLRRSVRFDETPNVAVSQLTDGIYFAKVAFNSKTYHQKLIVKHL